MLDMNRLNRALTRGYALYFAKEWGWVVPVVLALIALLYLMSQPLRAGNGGF